MVSAKEIRTKIVSVQSTKKITKAMEMVAASKMRKTQERMVTSRPYANNIRKVINHLLLGHLEYKHPYLYQRKIIKNIGYLIISTDRGLCGSLNSTLFKKLLLDIKHWSDKNIKSELAIIGSKGVSFFNSIGSNIVAQMTGMGDNISLSDLIGPVKVMLEAYNKERIDRLYIASNEFNNTMSQTPIITQLLPLYLFKKEQTEIQAKKEIQYKTWDYLYEPDSKKLFDILLNRYIESQVYQSVVENLASEQAARMIAMKSATDNGGNLINELQLIYNRVRQASITQELNEIVSGASAV
ncbi:F0F1 ATP synthase subunit gamma [Pantoea sp. Aalb]|uniref:F0F1 ATP synthase subunit gamma n=1 Tax=Pantoea sp. Aalb TaxID=2576762 RepID=UPI0013299674|nr:F0F1 ATP synthase subunit gamma [Pantoea sp. Aalb]MXP67618.1 F0F1 ATP synthase subunit gamma [Pantoea sp. Aalb]